MAKAKGFGRLAPFQKIVILGGAVAAIGFGVHHFNKAQDPDEVQKKYSNLVGNLDATAKLSKRPPTLLSLEAVLWGMHRDQSGKTMLLATPATDASGICIPGVGLVSTFTPMPKLARTRSFEDVIGQVGPFIDPAPKADICPPPRALMAPRILAVVALWNQSSPRTLAALAPRLGDLAVQPAPNGPSFPLRATPAVDGSGICLDADASGGVRLPTFTADRQRTKSLTDPIALFGNNTEFVSLSVCPAAGGLAKRR